MKRTSLTQRERQRRLSKKRQRVLTRQRCVRERLRRRRLRIEGKRGYYPLLSIAAPETFSLDTELNRGSLLSFLGELRLPFISGKTGTILVDMHRTSRFVADGTLLFFAEVSRLLALGTGKLRFRIKPPVNQKADHVLCQIGLYELCGMSRSCKSVYGDVVHWQSAKGHIVDNNICAPAIEIHEGQLAKPLVDGIFRGLGEAMTNTVHHAYMAIRQDGLHYQQPGEDWWMFSQARDGLLSVVFCDLGVGIPNTLPVRKRSLFDKIVALGLSNSDAACIEQAVEDTRSRTNMSGRGHGLGNIVSAVSQHDKGNVIILSNRGCYTFKDGKPTKYDFKESIMGTLISWRIPLLGA